MLSIYCSGCGYRDKYEIRKPNFCSSCGQSYGVALANSVPKPVKENKRVVESNRDDEDEDNNDFIIPNIKKFKLEYIPDDYGRVKIGDVLGSNAGEKYERKVPKKVNVNKVLEELRLESQSAARPITIGD
jgi:hypothetical protein